MGERIVQIRDVEHFHWQLSESECRVPFSSNGASLSLAAAAELALLDAHLKAGNARVRSARKSIWGLIRESRWPHRNGHAKLSDGDATVIVLPSDSDDRWWMECIRSLMADLVANGFALPLSRGLAGAVIEMVDNTWLHSDATSLNLLAYQVRRRKFAFSVVDTGIGMLESLKRNPRLRYLSSSMEAIGKAIEPGVSRFEHGGMGFPSLFHALASFWGTVRIRSGEAALVIDHTRADRSKASTYLPHLPGTHISVRCALDPPSIAQN